MNTMILYGSDKARMIHFLNEVLDFEWNQETDLVSFSNYHFKFLEKSNHSVSKLDLFFWLNSKEELDEVISKFNFYIYRIQDRRVLEQIDFFDNQDYFGVALTDLDGRVWNYGVRKEGLKNHENH